MNVLGVSFGYHDSSACLVRDGQIVGAAAEERFSRQKHDSGYPRLAIDWCLAQGNIGVADLDHVVYHEDPHAKFSRVLAASLAPFPGSRKEFVNSMKAWIGRKLWSLQTLSSRLDVPPEKVSYLSHHFSHAVQAFMGSGFEEAAILVVDAVGDWASSALYRGAWEQGKPRVERVLEVAFPNSLGLAYSAITGYLGFNPNDSEASTMALAAFGDPGTYGDAMRGIIAERDDGTYEVDQSWFNLTRFYRGPVTERFLQTFGPARRGTDPLDLRCIGDPGAPGEDARRLADVAAATQRVIEERLLGLARTLHGHVPLPNLCYAGGVSLNCVANTRLLREGPFERVFIPPDPGDGGTSVGAALYVGALEGQLEPQGLRYGPYLGASYPEEHEAALVDHVDTAHIVPYLKAGVTLPEGTRLRRRTFADEAELCREVARLLLDRQIVGWYQGRFEIGPRALGNRSILMRPDDLELAARLSRKVKERASYRPYAFSVAEEGAAALLDAPPEHLGLLRWMQYALTVRAEVADRVAAALHVDQTTRPQVCGRGDNPRFHALLRAFGEGFGLPVLLNTSFNASGYPIVAAPVEALSMFMRTEMDALVLNDTLIWKHHGD